MPAYSHLLDEERDQIAVCGRPATRSAPFQRAKSTISRELRRNALPSGRYLPLHATGAYQLRRRREAILEKDPTLRTFVRDRLAEGWAPEQIAGWLKAGNERGLRALGFLRRGPLALSDVPPQTDVEAQRLGSGHRCAAVALFGAQAEGVRADGAILPDHRHSRGGTG